MSADNGIYILETNGRVVSTEKEYRVAHLMAVENYMFDENAPDPHKMESPLDENGRPMSTWRVLNENDPRYAQQNAIREAYTARYFSPIPDVQISNARGMWVGKVFYKREEALMEADRMYQEIMSDEFCPIVEYGISFIVIDAVF